MIVNKEEWIHANHKPLRHPNNKEFVTARVNIINKKKVIRISIGIDVCEILSFNKNDRVNIFISKKNRDFMLIKKSIDSFDGYLLSRGKSHSNFMTFDFRYETIASFKLSQTIILDYDINDERTLLVDLSKIKWSK